VRRNLRPEELGDLLELPLNAVLALRRRDGSVLQTPVWHTWTGTQFVFFIPAGDRKIEMLRRDPRISLVVADSAFPFRTMQVEGTARVQTNDFRERARKIAGRYVAAHDPGTPVDDYIGKDDGVVVEVEADTVRAWDYADSEFVSHSG
jgi:PPOX class probable F420-dependent enzyme